MRSTQQPIRVGVLFSETGVTSVIERSQRLGTWLAIEEVNAAGGVHGREIELVAYDPESRPSRFQSLAKQLVTDDGVRIILGCYMSSTRKALLPVVEKFNALLMYPTLYEGFEYSRNVIYTGASPNQNSVQLAEYMTRTHGSRVFMVGSDYIYPYESNRIMSDLVLERGGNKVGEVYLPLDASWEDFITLMKRIKAQAPDFIFSTVVGDGTALLYKAYRQLGMDPARMPIASLTTCEAEVRQMGREAAEGHITAAPYFQSVDTPANHACLQTLRQRFGHDMITNQCWEAAYFQAHLLADAMRRAGTDEVEAILRVLPGSEFDAPQGRVRIDEHNHHTYLRPRIGRANASGQFDILEETHHWVRPDPYLISHSLAEWSSRVRVLDQSP